MNTVSAPASTVPPPTAGRALRLILAFALLASLATYVVLTWRWPIIQDSAVMHYVIFLTRHGLRPYRDITDNNLPGAYLLERAAMAVFGGGDLGWRLYDLSLSAALIAAFTYLAWPQDRLAGLVAGGLFALRHGSEGPWFAAEREQEITVLIAIACVCLFAAVRHRRPWAALGFGLLAGLAVTIKPTLAPFSLLVLLSLPWAMGSHRRLRPALPYAAWSVLGLLLAAAMSLLFFHHYGDFSAFLHVTRMVTPVYAGLNDPGRRYLITHVAPAILVPVLLLGLWAALLLRQWSWERSVLLLAAAVGLLSYFVQRKGFLHHRYMFVAFSLLLASMELLPLTRTPVPRRWLGYATVVFLLLGVLPRDLKALHELPDALPMQAAMQSDLEQLGGPRLQGQVQCFDMILGCLNALYHLQLRENTGFTGDMLLFSRPPGPATSFYQALYRQDQAAHPADVLVVTNEEFGGPNSYRRLNRWPWFAGVLASQYTLAVERTFPREGKLRHEAPAPPDAALSYRIYLRKGIAFPPLNQATVPGQQP